MKEDLKDFIKDQAEKFHKSAKGNHRFLSWEHCYSFFLNNKENLKDDATIDLAALNLAFYLASWGMYRGSSFLLQYDYKIFIPIIKELFEENKFNDLFEKPDWDKIKEARDIITKNNPFTNSTDTLITKILMGIFGCVPAFDRFFKEGHKIFQGKNISFNHKGFEKILEIYQKLDEKYWEKFKLTSHLNLSYPKMKIIDMAFWQYGFDHYFKGYTLTDDKITLYRRKPKENSYKAFDNSFSKNDATTLKNVLENKGTSVYSSEENLSEIELKEILRHLIERALQKKDLSV